MPHVRKASASLIRGYNVIVSHFEHTSQGGVGTAEVTGRATFVVRKLKNFKLLSFLFFMQDLLDIIAALSLEFQKHGNTSVDFLDALETAYLKLIELSLTPGEHYSEFIAACRDGSYKGHVLLDQLTAMVQCVTLCWTISNPEWKTIMTSVSIKFSKRPGSLIHVSGPTQGKN